MNIFLQLWLNPQGKLTFLPRKYTWHKKNLTNKGKLPQTASGVINYSVKFTIFYLRKVRNKNKHGNNSVKFTIFYLTKVRNKYKTWKLYHSKESSIRIQHSRINSPLKSLLQILFCLCLFFLFVRFVFVSFTDGYSQQWRQDSDRDFCLKWIASVQTHETYCLPDHKNCLVQYGHNKIQRCGSATERSLGCSDICRP